MGTRSEIDVMAMWTPASGWLEPKGNNMDNTTTDHPAHDTAAALQEAVGFSTWRLRVMLEELVFAAKVDGDARPAAANSEANYFEALRLVRALESALLTGQLVWVSKRLTGSAK